MTKEKLLEIIHEMMAENWADSDLDARTEKILAFIVKNDYEGREEDLEAFIDRINSAQTETPALFIVQDALQYEGWNFEKAMKKFYVWGTGPAQSALIREAEVSQEAVDAALAHDFVFDSPDDWSVEVVTTEEDIDALTRFDPAVAGYVVAEEKRKRGWQNGC